MVLLANIVASRGLLAEPLHNWKMMRWGCLNGPVTRDRNFYSSSQHNSAFSTVPKGAFKA